MLNAAPAGSEDQFPWQGKPGGEVQLQMRASQCTMKMHEVGMRNARLMPTV